MKFYFRNAIRASAITLILFVVIPLAGAGILTPLNNEVLDNDFFVTVQQDNTTSVEAKLVGYSWAALEQVSSNTYMKKFNISLYPDGDYVLSVRYTNENMNIIFFPPLNVKIDKPAPIITPTPSPFESHNLSVVGISAGNYTNITKMWVSVLDALTGSPVNSAVIVFYNPLAVASWTTQNGLTKVDMSNLQPDSYLVRVTAQGYNNISFFLNVTPPPLPRISVEGLRGVVEIGEVMSLRFTPESVNLTLRYYNGTMITRLYQNSSDYKINTSGFTQSEYKLYAEKDGHEPWSGEFSVFHPVATTPAPTPTPSATPCDVIIPQTGRCATFKEKEFFDTGYNLQTTTPTPTPANTPAVQVTPLPQGSQGNDSWMPYIVVIALVGAGIYMKKTGGLKRGDGTPAKPLESEISATLEGKDNNVFETTLQCPHCEYTETVKLPNGSAVTEGLTTALLAGHISKEHSKRE